MIFAAFVAPIAIFAPTFALALAATTELCPATTFSLAATLPHTQAARAAYAREEVNQVAGGGRSPPFLLSDAAQPDV